MPAPFRFASYRVHLQISKSEWDGLFSSSAAKQRSNARQKFRECERLDQVIVGTFIQSFDPVLDCIASGKDENSCLQSAFSESGEYLEPIPAWKHEIQNNEIEHLGVDEKKSFL